MARDRAIGRDIPRGGRGTTHCAAQLVDEAKVAKGRGGGGADQHRLIPDGEREGENGCVCKQEGRDGGGGGKLHFYKKNPSLYSIFLSVEN